MSGPSVTWVAGVAVPVAVLLMTLQLMTPACLVAADGVEYDGDGYVIRETPLGKVRGNTTTDERTGVTVEAFYGLPYVADPPVGSKRFCSTRSIAVATDDGPNPWEGAIIGEPFNATEWGAACAQPVPPTPTGWLAPSRVSVAEPELSEDCLTFNIFLSAPSNQSTGDGAGNSTLAPILMFVPGGSNAFGSASQYDCTRFVAEAAAEGQPVVCILINYRLSVLSTFVGEDACPNNEARDGGDPYGALSVTDVFSALKTARTVAKAFGADAGRVTLMGQSAANTVLGALFASPLAEPALPMGFFLASTSPTGSSNGVATRESSQALSARLADSIGGVANLTTLNWTDLWNLNMYGISNCPFFDPSVPCSAPGAPPVYFDAERGDYAPAAVNAISAGGGILPVAPVVWLTENSGTGALNGSRFMVGSTGLEAGMQGYPESQDVFAELLSGGTPESAKNSFYFGDTNEALTTPEYAKKLAAYYANESSGDLTVAWAKMHSDINYACGEGAIAELAGAAGAETWLYEWGGLDGRASHALDLPYWLMDPKMISTFGCGPGDAPGIPGGCNASAGFEAGYDWDLAKEAGAALRAFVYGDSAAPGLDGWPQASGHARADAPYRRFGKDFSGEGVSSVDAGGDVGYRAEACKLLDEANVTYANWPFSVDFGGRNTNGGQMQAWVRSATGPW